MTALNGHGGALVAPQDLEAERAVLGAVLLAGDVGRALAAGLDASDFYREAHRRIFAAMVALRGGVDAVTVAAELERTGELEDLGGRAAIDELAGVVPAVGNVDNYVAIVLERARARRERELALRLLDGDPQALQLLAELAVDERWRDGRIVTATAAARVAPQTTRWLWSQRIPLGSPTLLAGRQGLGKSTLAFELAARVSRGELGGDVGEPADVLLLSYEDNAATTIVPRLLAAGADLERVHILAAKDRHGEAMVSLPGDVAQIAEHVRALGVRFVVVDPIVAGLPSDETNAHRDQDVRRALAPIARLAEELELAVLCLIHWNKGAGTDPLSRVSGSIAFTAAARSVLAFGPDPEDPEAERSSGRVLAHAKCNLGPLAPSLACRVEGRELEHGDATLATSRLVIVGEHQATADELLKARDVDERSQLDEAAEWLEDELSDGEWHQSRDIKAAAKGAGISERTLERAHARLGAERDRQGFPSRAVWRLTVPPRGVGGSGDGGTGGADENGAVGPNAAAGEDQSRQYTELGGTEVQDEAVERITRAAQASFANLIVEDVPADDRGTE